jgi:hypothetical protein
MIRKFVLLILILMVISAMMTSCNNGASELDPSNNEASEIDPPVIETEPAPVLDYSGHILIEVDSNNDYFATINVLEGELRFISGTTNMPGSLIPFEEYKDFIDYHEGLLIEINGGELEIMGTVYPDGTQFIVDDQENWIVVK